MEDFCTQSHTGCSILNIFQVDSIGKTQYKKPPRRTTKSTTTTAKSQKQQQQQQQHHAAAAAAAAVASSSIEDDVGDEEEMMVDQTDEESKALVDELYKRDTTGLVGDEGVTIPPPLLTHKFDIKRDSKTCEVL